jgi:hypothetical protein
MMSEVRGASEFLRQLIPLPIEHVGDHYPSAFGGKKA